MGELVMFYALFCLATGPAVGDLPVSWFRMPFQENYWLWKGIGFGGLGVFQARWIVQWIHSERRRESVMPVSFWWLSLIGSLLELCYFLRQQDSVGIVGCLNFFPYLRNLVLIYRKRRQEPAAGLEVVSIGSDSVQP